MQFRTLAKLATMMSVLAAVQAFAHHSNAMYDRDKELTLTGTVREFQWTNPHTFIELTVDGPKGQYNYTVEGPTPGVLRSQGWKFNSLKAGDKVTVKVHPLKSGREGGGLVSVMKDGVMLTGGASYQGDKAGK